MSSTKQEDVIADMAKRILDAKFRNGVKKVAAGRKSSNLERRFDLIWRALDGPALVSEYRFHTSRRWRADYAHIKSRTLIELEGGAWIGGRHNRASGFVADAEKYLEAALAGWRVIRLVGAQINLKTVGRIVTAIRNEWRTNN